MFIRVDYTLEPAEFARAIRTAYQRGYRTSQAVGVVLGLALAALYVVSSAEHLVPPKLTTTTVPVAVVVLYLILLPWIRGVVLGRQYQGRKISNVGVTIAEDGMTWEVRTQSAEHRSVMAWSSFAKIQETPEFFLFFQTRKQASAIPKRALTSDQAELFSRFVEHEYPQARRPQPEAQATQV